MTYDYGFCNGYNPDWTFRYTRSSEIVNKLDASVPLQRAWINYVKDLCVRGERYSFEASDVLSGAYRAIGKSEIKSWEQGFVDHWSTI